MAVVLALGFSGLGIGSEGVLGRNGQQLPAQQQVWSGETFRATARVEAGQVVLQLEYEPEDSGPRTRVVDGAEDVPAARVPTGAAPESARMPALLVVPSRGVAWGAIRRFLTNTRPEPAMRKVYLARSPEDVSSTVLLNPHVLPGAVELGTALVPNDLLAAGGSNVVEVRVETGEDGVLVRWGMWPAWRRPYCRWTGQALIGSLETGRSTSALARMAEEIGSLIGAAKATGVVLLEGSEVVSYAAVYEVAVALQRSGRLMVLPFPWQYAHGVDLPVLPLVAGALPEVGQLDVAAVVNVSKDGLFVKGQNRSEVGVDFASLPPGPVVVRCDQTVEWMVLQPVVLRARESGRAVFLAFRPDVRGATWEVALPLGPLTTGTVPERARSLKLPGGVSVTEMQHATAGVGATLEAGPETRFAELGPLLGLLRAAGYAWFDLR